MKKDIFKAYVEDITKNDTCHRPDISCYTSCDPCVYVEYCLCKLNTSKFKQKGKRSRL